MLDEMEAEKTHASRNCLSPYAEHASAPSPLHFPRDPLLDCFPMTTPPPRLTLASRPSCMRLQYLSPDLSEVAVTDGGLLQ